MSKKARRNPQRKCVFCGQHKDKNDFIRIVNNKEEGVLIDDTYRKNGRGAYLCRNKECVEKAIQSGRLNHALKTNISKDIFKQLKEIVMEEE